MKNYIVILGLLALSFAANASNVKLQMRSEEGRWIVEKIGVAADGWPEILSRQTYPTEQAAQVQLQTLERANPSFFTTQDLQVQPTMASGVLWVTRNQWNNDWEEKFGQWIEKEVDADFYVRNKVKTDCADVAYSLRWIFAYMNGLPAGANLGGSSGFMTNETLRGEWAKLPSATEWNKDKRFLKALDYLLDQTYTHTLWDDSFPVALNRRALLSGSYHLNLSDKSGHTQVVRWFDDGSKIPFITLNSTVPREVRTLMENMLWADYPVKGKSGLLRFRWAVKTKSGIKLAAGKDVPGYSLEQFELKGQKEFPIALFEHMGYKADSKSIREFLLTDVYGQMLERIDIVKKGVEKCKTISCKPGTQGYEDWGTPSRDGRIGAKIKTIRRLSEYGPVTDSSESLSKVVGNFDGTEWTLNAMIWNWSHDQISSDPMVSENQRWGTGTRSWVDEQKKFLTQKLSEREAHLKKSAETCKTQDCSIMGPLWSTVSATAIDSQIRDRLSYVIGGRGVLPNEVYASLDAATNENIYVINGRNLSLQFLLQNQMGMNSSPMAKPSEQWGLAANVMLLPASTVPYFDNWTVSVSKGFVQNADTGETVQLPGKLLAAMDLAPVLLLKTEAGFTLFNLKTSEAAPLNTADITPADAFFFKEDKLVQTTSEKSLIWSVTTTPLVATPYAQFNEQLEIVMAPQILRGKSTGTLLDVKTGQRWLSDPKESVAVGNTDAIMLSSEARQHRIIVRKTGQSIELDFLKDASFVTYSPNLDVVITMNTGSGGVPSTMFVLDANYKVVHKQAVVGVYCYPSYNSQRVMCFRDPENTDVYLRNGNQFEKMNITGKLSWMTEKYMVKKEGDSRVLYDRATMKPLFKAAQIRNVSEGDLVAVTMKQGEYAHLVDLKNPSTPMLTNIAKEAQFLIFSSLSDDPKNFMIIVNGEESIWSRGSLLRNRKF